MIEENMNIYIRITLQKGELKKINEFLSIYKETDFNLIVYICQKHYLEYCLIDTLHYGSNYKVLHSMERTTLKL